MANVRSWLKYGISTGVVVASICCMVLTLDALCEKGNTTAGIATIQFNLTNLQKRDFIQSLGPESATGVVTAAPVIVSQVQSAEISVTSAAVGLLTTAIPDSVEALIPRNFTIGTKQFCVGLVHGAQCYTLPPRILQFIPAEFQKLVINDIQPLDTALAKITKTNIEDALIVGVVFVFIMSCVSICLMFGGFLCLPVILQRFRYLMVGCLLFIGLICCALFSMAAFISRAVKSESEHLSSSIQVEQGEVDKLSIGDLGCAIIIAVLGSITPLLI